MIFVDAGAWIARFYPADQHHAAAVHWFRQNRQPLFTTDYIIDEALTVLKARGELRRAFELGTLLFSGKLALVHYLTLTDIGGAWNIFQNYADKDWSFTDCSSKFVIEKSGISYAFSFDHHFRQFGTVVVLP